MFYASGDDSVDALHCAARQKQYLYHLVEKFSRGVRVAKGM